MSIHPAGESCGLVRWRFQCWFSKSLARVTIYDPISIWEIDMGDLYGISDINEISIGISIHGIWGYIDMGYGISIW